MTQNIKNFFKTAGQKISKSAEPTRRYFGFKDASTTFKKEILGGLSTFLAMAYILAVNPEMLGHSNGAYDAKTYAPTYAGVFFLGTAISAFVGTMAMALYAKVPVALAPGMGVNAFFAFTVAGNVLGMQVEEALIATFISGLLYMIIALTPLRNVIAKMLPKNLKLAIGAMIGLFLAYIGLNDAGIIVSDASAAPWLDTKIMSATSTKLGNLSDPFVIIGVITLLMVFVLHFLKVKGAALIAMIAAIIMLAIAYAAGVTDSERAFKMQDWNEFGKFDTLAKGMWSSFGSAMSNGKIYIAIFVFLYIDFFDTTGTLFAVGKQANLDQRNPEWLKKANTVDAFSTIFGSMMLTSTTTSYIESSVGVSQGARTGFASLITALCFGIAILAWPIMSPIMPIQHQVHGVSALHSPVTIMPVTGPVLVLVGSLMMSQLKHFEWEKTIDIPVLFVTLVFGMLSFSISTGIAVGIIVYYLLNSAVLIKHLITKKPIDVNDIEFLESDGVKNVKQESPKDLKKRLLNPVMIVLFILALVYFGTMPLYTFK